MQFTSFFRAVFFALLLCFSLMIQTGFAHPQTPKQRPIETEEIDKLFGDCNSLETPGAAIAVIKDGKVFYTQGYGSANLEYGIPIKPDTIFHAASLSKQFTAFAILLLQKEGKLSLDDDVRKHIPELPDFGTTITLRHLANHSSGLRDQWRLLMMAGWRLDDVITKQHIMKLIKRQGSLNFPPGDRNLYSNTGYTLLAEVVARVSGKSFAEFTKENIFVPLKMKNTQFCDDHEKIVPNRAYSYSKEGDGYNKKVLSYATVGATSLLTTVEDFSLWALNFENPELGGSKIIEQLNAGTVRNDGKETGFAFGQMVGTYQGINVFVHSGSDAGFRAYFARVPDHNLSIVVLSNSSSISPIEKVIGVVDMALRDFFPSSVKATSKLVEHSPEKFIKLTPKQLQRFTGKYWEPKEQYTRNIQLRDGSLYYQRPEGNETKLAPIGPTEFKMIGDSEDVSVIFNDSEIGEPRMQVVINNDDPLNLLAYGPVDLEQYAGIFYSVELATSYTFIVAGNKLVAQHSRLDDIEFSPIKKDLFQSKNRAFQSLVFVRGEGGTVDGAEFSNDRVKNLRLERK